MMSAQCQACLIWFDVSMLNARGVCARCRSRGTWCAAMLLLLACGGSAESSDPQDVYQPRNWCCMTAPGYVECGLQRKTAPVCYCDGVVHDNACEDP